MDMLYLPRGKHGPLTIGRLSSNKAGGKPLPGKAKVLLHTTEGSANAKVHDVGSYLNDVGYQVHFVVNLVAGSVVQMLPLNVSAFGLANKPGGYETNREGRVIQIEICGKASMSAARTHEELRRLAYLLWLIKHRVDFDWKAPMPFTASRNVDPAKWVNVSGIYGHQHVPENDHWDPGKLNVKKVIAFAKEL